MAGEANVNRRICDLRRVMLGQDIQAAKTRNTCSLADSRKGTKLYLGIVPHRLFRFMSWDHFIAWRMITTKHVATWLAVSNDEVS